MVSPADYADIVLAPWRVWHRGQWRPVTGLFAPGVGRNVPTRDKFRASTAVCFVGNDSEAGDWEVISIQPGEVFGREASYSIPGLDWHQGARLRKASPEAPQRVWDTI